MQLIFTWRLEGIRSIVYHNRVFSRDRLSDRYSRMLPGKVHSGIAACAEQTSGYTHIAWRVAAGVRVICGCTAKSHSGWYILRSTVFHFSSLISSTDAFFLSSSQSRRFDLRKAQQPTLCRIQRAVSRLYTRLHRIYMKKELPSFRSAAASPPPEETSRAPAPVKLDEAPPPCPRTSFKIPSV